jgi:hypothetical protein
MTVVFMDTDDVYQLLLKFDVPGVRKDAGRLWKGVQTGDAGVMGELLQAAYDPSAGQRAVQAGEDVQQPSLALNQQGLMSMMTSAMTSAMAVAIKTNNAEMTSAMTSAMTSMTSAMTSTINAAIRSNNAEIGASMRSNNAEIGAAMRSNNAAISAVINNNILLYKKP